MKTNNKIIKEEVSKFDYLGISNIQKDNEEYDVLSSYELQKQFLYDLFYDKDKIKLSTSEANITKQSKVDDGDKRGVFKIDYSTNVEYEYDNQTFSFEICFYGEDVDFVTLPSEFDGTEKMYIDWDNIIMEFYIPSGDGFNFHVLDKAKPETRRKFIREFIGIFLEIQVKDD